MVTREKVPQPALCGLDVVLRRLRSPTVEFPQPLQRQVLRGRRVQHPSNASAAPAPSPGPDARKCPLRSTTDRDAASPAGRRTRGPTSPGPAPAPPLVAARRHHPVGHPDDHVRRSRFRGAPADQRQGSPVLSAGVRGEAGCRPGPHQPDSWLVPNSEAVVVRGIDLNQGKVGVGFFPGVDLNCPPSIIDPDSGHAVENVVGVGVAPNVDRNVLDTGTDRAVLHRRRHTRHLRRTTRWQTQTRSSRQRARGLLDVPDEGVER